MTAKYMTAAIRTSCVLRAAVELTGERWTDICSTDRRHALVEARTSISGAVYHITGLSMPDIARMFGRTAHSPIDNQIKRFHARPSEDQIRTIMDTLALAVTLHREYDTMKAYRRPSDMRTLSREEKRTERNRGEKATQYLGLERPPGEKCPQCGAMHAMEPMAGSSHGNPNVTVAWRCLDCNHMQKIKPMHSAFYRPHPNKIDNAERAARVASRESTDD